MSKEAIDQAVEMRRLKKELATLHGDNTRYRKTLSLLSYMLDEQKSANKVLTIKVDIAERALELACEYDGDSDYGSPCEEPTTDEQVETFTEQAERIIKKGGTQ